MSMIDMAERIEAGTVTTPKANRAHRCDECRRTIQPGERYERVKGLVDGDWSTSMRSQWQSKSGDLLPVPEWGFPHGEVTAQL